jgi:polar amino acid transport system substrate-binding protein
MSAMSKTPEREKEVDFSHVYHEAIPTLLSKNKIDAKSYADLKGKRVGVQLGSVYDIAFKALVLEEPGFHIEVVSLNLTGELLQELKKGKIECMVLDNIVAQNYAKEGFYVAPLPNQKVDAYSAAFPKGSVIFKKFNETLEGLKKEGFIEHLVQKWLVSTPK